MLYILLSRSLSLNSKSPAAYEGRWPVLSVREWSPLAGCGSTLVCLS